MACLLSFVVIQASVTPYLPTSYSSMPYIGNQNSLHSYITFLTCLFRIALPSMNYTIFLQIYSYYLLDFPVSNSVMLILALMVFNALSISATITTISVLSMEPRPKMPDWLDRLVCKSGKVEENPNMNHPEVEDEDPETEDVNTAPKSQRTPADIKKCSPYSRHPDKEQLDNKWKRVANIINNFLFLLFSLTFTVLNCTIFAVWILGANSASQVSKESV